MGKTESLAGRSPTSKEPMDSRGSPQGGELQELGVDGAPRTHEDAHSKGSSEEGPSALAPTGASGREGNFMAIN